MSIKTTIKCDRCGDVISEARVIIESPEMSRVDLCATCAAEFDKWMRGKAEKPVKADKPSKGAKLAQSIRKKAERKLPSGWTVQALAAEMGRNRSTVQQALGSLSPKPERMRVRDSKTHWWYEYHLTTAQFNELKKRFGGGAK